MGKGTIVSGGTDGLYQIDYEVDKTRMQTRIDALVSAIEILTEVDIPEGEAVAAGKQTEHSDLLVQLNSAINLGNDTTAITKSLSIALSDLNAATNILSSSKMKLGSLTKEKQFLTDNLPPDEEIAAWCADLNESLSGEVGTIEIPGERTAPVIIMPGGSSGNDAIYDTDRDGQIVPVLGLSPSENYYNLAMMPGWQKYQPTFRLGVITNLNANLCDITLDAAISSLQGLDVNPDATLTNVPITYLTCDGAAFEVGDRVVVAYTGSGPGTTYTPSVIGFESNPKTCGLSTPIYYYREKEATAADPVDAHNAFLAAPWSAWASTTFGGNTPYYTSRNFGTPATSWRFRAREMKMEVSIPASGSWNVQARNESLGGAPWDVGGSETYLESDPVRNGIVVYTSHGGAWRNQFAVTGADIGTITAITKDLNDYPFHASSGLQELGWAGNTAGSLQIV